MKYFIIKTLINIECFKNQVDLMKELIKKILLF